MLCPMPQDNPAWLKHRPSHVPPVILLNTMVGISANWCIRYVYHSTNINAALQVISCSQLFFLETCGCSDAEVIAEMAGTRQNASKGTRRKLNAVELWFRSLHVLAQRSQEAWGTAICVSLVREGATPLAMLICLSAARCARRLTQACCPCPALPA